MSDASFSGNRDLLMSAYVLSRAYVLSQV